MTAWLVKMGVDNHVEPGRQSAADTNRCAAMGGSFLAGAVRFVSGRFQLIKPIGRAEGIGADGSAVQPQYASPTQCVFSFRITACL